MILEAVSIAMSVQEVKAIGGDLIIPQNNTQCGGRKRKRDFGAG